MTKIFELMRNRNVRSSCEPRKKAKQAMGTTSGAVNMTQTTSRQWSFAPTWNQMRGNEAAPKKSNQPNRYYQSTTNSTVGITDSRRSPRMNSQLLTKGVTDR